MITPLCILFGEIYLEVFCQILFFWVSNLFWQSFHSGKSLQPAYVWVEGGCWKFQPLSGHLPSTTRLLSLPLPSSKHRISVLISEIGYKTVYISCPCDSWLRSFLPWKKGKIGVLALGVEGMGMGWEIPPLTLFFPVASCPIWNDMKKWTHPN